LKKRTEMKALIFSLLLFTLLNAQTPTPGYYSMTSSTNSGLVTCCLPQSSQYYLVTSITSASTTYYSMQGFLETTECGTTNGNYFSFTASPQFRSLTTYQTTLTVSSTSNTISFYSSLLCNAVFTVNAPYYYPSLSNGSYSYVSSNCSTCCVVSSVSMGTSTGGTLLVASINFASGSECDSQVVNLPVNLTGVYTWSIPLTKITLDFSSTISTGNLYLTVNYAGSIGQTKLIQTECIQNSDCTPLSLCSNNICSNCPYMSCSTSDDCSLLTPTCTNGKCNYPCNYNGDCNGRQMYANCPSGLVCSGSLLRCVGCRTSSDCSSSTPYCLAASNTCSSVCGTNADCPTSFPKCSGGTCYKCLSSADCPSSSPFCNSNQCSQSCISSSQCPSSTPLCSSGICVKCLTNSNCPSGLYCNNNLNCVSCLSNANCGGSTPVCNPSSYTCTSTCTSNSQCPSNTPFCSGSNCVQCRSNSDCSSTNPYCNLLTNTCQSYCSADSQCPTSQTCSYGQCVQCVSNSVCNNMFPEGGVCTANNNCIQCAANSDCYTGHYCVNNACQPNCVADSNCENNFVCSSVTLQCVECEFGYQCSYLGQHVCENNQCIACTGSSDCNTDGYSGYYCAQSSGVYYCSANCADSIDSWCPSTYYTIIGAAVIGSGAIGFVVWKFILKKKPVGSLASKLTSPQVELQPSSK
jgi:hypothetical protein